MTKLYCWLLDKLPVPNDAVTPEVLLLIKELPGKLPTWLLVTPEDRLPVKLFPVKLDPTGTPDTIVPLFPPRLAYLPP